MTRETFLEIMPWLTMLSSTLLVIVSVKLIRAMRSLRSISDSYHALVHLMDHDQTTINALTATVNDLTARVDALRAGNGEPAPDRAGYDAFIASKAAEASRARDGVS